MHSRVEEILLPRGIIFTKLGEDGKHQPGDIETDSAGIAALISEFQRRAEVMAAGNRKVRQVRIAFGPEYTNSEYQSVKASRHFYDTKSILPGPGSLNHIARTEFTIVGLQAAKQLAKQVS